MAVQLTRQQVNEFRSELISLYMTRQQDLVLDGEMFSGRVDDSELEGCINLLFDLNYADPDHIADFS